jgi:hypothetical protein
MMVDEGDASARRTTAGNGARRNERDADPRRATRTREGERSDPGEPGASAATSASAPGSARAFEATREGDLEEGRIRDPGNANQHFRSLV